MEAFILWFGPVYIDGIIYTTLACIAISLLFAFWRWYRAVKQYVETGSIDDSEGTLFLGEDNWFHGNIAHMKYGTNPWLVGLDIAIMSLAGLLLAVVWPISVIVTIVIAYAKISRVRFVRKKEFMDRLSGEHT